MRTAFNDQYPESLMRRRTPLTTAAVLIASGGEAAWRRSPSDETSSRVSIDSLVGASVARRPIRGTQTSPAIRHLSTP
jgi:hypothetical protein